MTDKKNLWLLQWGGIPNPFTNIILSFHGKTSFSVRKKRKSWLNPSGKIGWSKVSPSRIQTFKVDYKGQLPVFKSFLTEIWRLKAKLQRKYWCIPFCFLLDNLAFELGLILSSYWTDMSLKGFCWCPIKYGIYFIIFIHKLNRTWC